MWDVYLLLGSNLGDRESNLLIALEMLETGIGLITARSSVYITAPWGNTDQPEFLNQVIKLETAMPPFTVMEKALKIEDKIGRKRTEKWSSRSIDIDILFYGDLIMDEQDLTIPHPRLHLRRFTLAPLLEMIPDFVHPGLKKTISELYCDLQDNLPVRKTF